MNNSNITTTTTTSQVTITELVKSLEQATTMAKQLQTTTNPTTHLLEIYTSLHHSHHLLSSFLSHSHLPISPPTAETSLSSATGAAEPMQIADDDDGDGGGDVNDYEEDSSNAIMIENVEERMRDCFIKSNKRPKRPLSPAAIAAVEDRRFCAGDDGDGVSGFDPFGTKLRALELIYQFHG